MVEGKIWRPNAAGKPGFFEPRPMHLGGRGSNKLNFEFAKIFKVSDKKVLTQAHPGIIDRVTYR